VDEEVTLEGAADDPQDGALSGKQLTWTVVLHHASHTHPFLGPTSGRRVRFTAPRPENFLAATNSYLEVRLTATDSAGLTTTVSQRLNPHSVEVTFATDPPGGPLVVNGVEFDAPRSFTSWAGLPLEVEARDQVKDGARWVFVSWSDEGRASHTIETPDEPRTYTATFRRED
jgi:hypothetical protein